MENGTRRLDVDTKWLNELGVTAAKDALTIQDYHRMRNHLEDKYTKVRVPAGKVAETIQKQPFNGSEVQAFKVGYGDPNAYEK